MTYIVHRADPRSVSANCGANLATPGHLARLSEQPLLVLPDEAACARGCYPKHRAEGITPEQIRLRDMSRPLTPGRHVAEVAA